MQLHVKVVLVVAPHPDDETLGCGGTLLRHAAQGDAVHWMVVTEMAQETGHAPERRAERQREIEAVAKAYGMADVHALGFPTTRLDALPMAQRVERASAVFARVQPHTVYLPHPGDAHSDHRMAFEMCTPAAKWFRLDSIREVFAYETLSETGFHLSPSPGSFAPNLYVDVSCFLDRKLEILKLYGGEIGAFPFPRSVEAVRALAALRGAESGFLAAEAFSTLRLRR